VAVAVAEAAEASAARAVLSRSRPSLEEQLHTRGELELVPQIFSPHGVCCCCTCGVRRLGALSQTGLAIKLRISFLPRALCIDTYVCTETARCPGNRMARKLVCAHHRHTGSSSARERWKV
jgi:hypothetical protein